MEEVDDAIGEDTFDLDLGRQLEDAVLEDAAAAWHMRERAKSKALHSFRKDKVASSAADTHHQQQQQQPPQQQAADSSAGQRDTIAADRATAADAASSELPQISKLLHDNPPCSQGSQKQGKHKRGGPDMAVSATAAVGGLVALTGSLLSYAVARAHGSRRERKLQDDLRRKEAALLSMQSELEGLKATAQRMVQLEQELAASNTHLLAMNQEVERARAASRRIEGDMAVFQDQLQSLSSTEAEIKAAMTLAEAKAAQAEQRRQEAEAQRRQAEARWQAARKQLEQAQGEVDTLRGELGLRGSQLQGLERELEFTRRQLANAEKCVEHAQMERRQQRTGYGSYEEWD